jgi:TetR/AcrR family transcriptional regulator
MHTESTEDQHGSARILAAAQQLFARKGFAATSIQEIAEAAGVSKSNVFHHYKSKEELYIAVIRCACTEAGARAVESLDGPDPFSLRLQRMMTADIEFMFEQPERAQLVLREIMNTGPDDPDQPAPSVLRANSAELVATIRAAQQAGEIRADVDPAAVAFLFLAANKFYFQARNVIRHLPEVDFADDHHRYVAKVADLVLKGVLPR